MAKIPIRTGELGESRYILINDLRKFTKEDRRKTAFICFNVFKEEEVLDKKFYPSLKLDSKNIKILSDKYKINLKRKIIIFAPGAAFGQSKMWPVERFKELGQKLNKDFLILILGSENEKNWRQNCLK